LSIAPTPFPQEFGCLKKANSLKLKSDEGVLISSS